MWRIRYFEETVLDLFNKGHIRGTAHLYIGMEAVAAGTRAAMGPDDFLASTHRGHGHSLAMGLDPKPMMAELLGRGDGYCKGKGGSMHVACLALGMLGADAVVGANAPITTGAALAARLKGEDRVGISFFGDGAASQGVVLEALNIAAVSKLPVVFICENNQWALSTSIQSTLSVLGRGHPRPRLSACRAPSWTVKTASPCTRRPRRQLTAPAPAAARP